MQMGASIIEKHFIIDDAKGLDDRFSLRVEDFKKMVQKIRENERVMGKVAYGPQTDAEKYNRGFRRSLYAIVDIKKGEMLTPENVRSLRPQVGLMPKEYDAVLGKVAATDIERGTPLTWELLGK
jgi:sialic acid synthase SpsE